MGARSPRGYGLIGTPLGTRRAHQVSVFLVTGQWPKGNTLHTCDNPPCVRFSHLEPGSQRKNVHDAIKRGLFPRSKLSESKVLAIRKLYHPAYGNVKRLANRFGVERHTIRSIVSRKSWTHV